ncbi:MAG: Branched-chain amino acid ABC transporter, amino acid-binding protein [Candidatus Carbobacillus altaicus]|uniref:Branched-chain amino acid ABC transporter, amino acid-binding protein n=1 Tax=Candidatus Carbonibacillus altaicus TaxID=2163959 RepID=A0A2R6XY96_9BACL|nr:MAG: Branched-chain amino acid ABC transporter, amino acid-binding protein [Candidatus Carbobacillus altaicus]
MLQRSFITQSYVFFALFSLLLFALSGCASKETGGGASENGEIVIGVEAPLTGDLAAEGQGFKKATSLVAEEINAQGGVFGGKKIKLIFEDDKGAPNEAPLAAQKLVSQGVVAVIGSYNSTATEAAQQVYNDAGILHITPSSTAVHLTEKGYPKFFRMCFIDSAQGAFAAKVMLTDLNAQHIAIIHDNSTYAKGLADWTKVSVEEGGGKVVFFDAINPNESDYSALLTKLKGEEPEAIFFSGYFSQAGLLVKQARDLDIQAPIIGGNATNNEEVIKTAGNKAEGFITITEPQPEDLPYDEAKAFLAAYKEKYKEDPVSVWTVMSADALRVIAEAIDKTESVDSTKLAAYLHNELKDFRGITGPVTYDQHGDRTGTVYAAYRVENGKFTLFVPPSY